MDWNNVRLLASFEREPQSKRCQAHQGHVQAAHPGGLGAHGAPWLTPLAWVRRDDHCVTLACKAPAVVVEDVSPTLAPCALAFSPPERTQAPPYPQWLVDCDAANVEHLPLFSDRGCSGVSRQDWQRGSLRISLALGDVVMVRDVLAAAVLPNRQPAGALQGRRSRPLSTDQSIGWKHARIRIPSRPSCQG